MNAHPETLIFQFVAVLLGLIGIYTAMSPAGFARRFLAERQQARLTPEAYPTVRLVGVIIAVIAAVLVLAPIFDFSSR